MELSDEIKESIRNTVDNASSDADGRLTSISRGQVIPDLEDMRFHEARRFSLGIAFVDINSYGLYLAEQGQRDTLFMLNVVIPTIMRIVREYNGFFEKNTGDGVLAYFGVGETDEDAVERLLEYLATVRWALNKHINPTLNTYDVPEVSVSAGASYSKDVHISRIGIRGQSRRTAVSTGANAAFKLQEIASESEFLADEGVNEFADKENGWGRFLREDGILEGFRYTPEDSATRPAKYYRFLGTWTS